MLLEHLNLVISQYHKMYLKDRRKYAYENTGMPQIFHTPSKDRASITETHSVGGERGTWVNFNAGPQHKVHQLSFLQ